MHKMDKGHSGALKQRRADWLPIICGMLPVSAHLRSELSGRTRTWAWVRVQTICIFIYAKQHRFWHSIAGVHPGLWVWCSSHHQANSVKALKETTEAGSTADNGLRWGWFYTLLVV